MGDGRNSALKSDFHIHTVMSGHAFCTLSECVLVAQQRGLSVIAITDHGPSMEHSAHEGYFEMSSRIPKFFNDLNVLFGCEMNILNTSGEVDLSRETMRKLDFLSAGLHKRTPYNGDGEVDNTVAIINTMARHPEINMITHPFRPEFPVSVRDVVQAAKEYSVILEINAALLLGAIQGKVPDSCLTLKETSNMVYALQSTGVGYLINSDAHFSSDIGITQAQFETLIAELGILPEHILNNSIHQLKKLIPSVGH